MSNCITNHTYSQGSITVHFIVPGRSISVEFINILILGMYRIWCGLCKSGVRTFLAYSPPAKISAVLNPKFKPYSIANQSKWVRH